MEAQVEQDLILSRAIVAMFVEPIIAPDTTWSFGDAAGYVQREFLPLLPGEAWRGGE